MPRQKVNFLAWPSRKDLQRSCKSTGEVMSLDRDRGLAYLKSQLASGNKVPAQGSIFVSLRDEDKQRAVPLIRQLVDLGYSLYATRGTSTMLYNEGIKTRAVFRISRGRPNLLDLMHDGEVQWIINTTDIHVSEENGNTRVPT